MFAPHVGGWAASKRILKERGRVGSLRMEAATMGDTLRDPLIMQVVRARGEHLARAAVALACVV